MAQVHKTSITVTTSCDAALHQRQLLRGYLVNLKYDGQQGSAEHALVLQQCWLGAFNLSIHIVEPFLRQTVYQGYPPPQLDGPLLVFSDLHDLDHYNNVSQSRGSAQVATCLSSTPIIKFGILDSCSKGAAAGSTCTARLP